LHALKKAANEFGQKMTNEQLKELLEKASSNGNELTFDDFYKVINKTS
jgi:Ca2+-binding EF-hand superfamily protein